MPFDENYKKKIAEDIQKLYKNSKPEEFAKGMEAIQAELNEGLREMQKRGLSESVEAKEMLGIQNAFGNLKDLAGKGRMDTQKAVDSVVSTLTGAKTQGRFSAIINAGKKLFSIADAEVKKESTQSLTSMAFKPIEEIRKSPQTRIAQMAMDKARELGVKAGMKEVTETTPSASMPIETRKRSKAMSGPSSKGRNRSGEISGR